MRKVELIHSEVINSTEVILVFETVFNKKKYGQYAIINLAEDVNFQNEAIEKTVTRLERMKREDVNEAIGN